MPGSRARACRESKRVASVGHAWKNARRGPISVLRTAWRCANGACG